MIVSLMCVCDYHCKLISICLARKNGVLASKGSSACSSLPLALMVLSIKTRLSSLMVFFTSKLTLILGFNKCEKIELQ